MREGEDFLHPLWQPFCLCLYWCCLGQYCSDFPEGKKDRFLNLFGGNRHLMIVKFGFR